ncbi:MAG: hypothetical protein J6W84_01980 [Bacteroidales bacterium]|nr:hypothetical protein [Bacteroidales bacterium]MBQ7489231.1 hypothetical protein [Bacteroidales bacterium]
MDILQNILLVLIPSLAVFLTSFFSIRFFIQNEQKKQLFELKQNSRSVIAPLRLQAYERMALFLERIDLNRLVVKMNNPELNSMQFQILLTSSIRSEFEHNLSQQIYFSTDLWNLIKAAEETTINIINQCAAQLTADAPSLELAKLILMRVAESVPTSAAMAALKAEIQEVF